MEMERKWAFQKSSSRAGCFNRGFRKNSYCIVGFGKSVILMTWMTIRENWLFPVAEVMELINEIREEPDSFLRWSWNWRSIVLLLYPTTQGTKEYLPEKFDAILDKILAGGIFYGVSQFWRIYWCHKGEKAKKVMRSCGGRKWRNAESGVEST